MVPSDADREGVFYHPQGYASVVRRLVIEAIDIIAVILLTMAVSIAASTILLSVAASPVDEAAAKRAFGQVFATMFVVVSVLYFVVLKASRFRTLGYKVAGTDIDDHAEFRPAAQSPCLPPESSPGSSI